MAHSSCWENASSGGGNLAGLNCTSVVTRGGGVGDDEEAVGAGVQSKPAC